MLPAMKLWPVVAALALLGAPAAHAQAIVSLANGSNLAHTCYISALSTVKYGARIAASGLGDCTAALDGPISAEVRAATYDNRGILYDAQQNYSAAWEDFDTSIRLNANLGDAYLNRGVALIRMKQPQAALGDIQHGMALGASLPEIGYYDLGVAEESMGQLQPAYDDFKRALAADPGFAPAAAALKNFIVTPGSGG